MSLPNPLVVLGGVGSPYTRKMLSYLRYKRIPHKMIWGDPSKYLDQAGIETVSYTHLTLPTMELV